MKEKEDEREAPRAEGIPCRGCGCTHHHVVYVRRLEGRVMRRRECRNCGRRMITYEEAPHGR
jgi:transcriptional regulator NrdR family protein